MNVNDPSHKMHGRMGNVKWKSILVDNGYEVRFPPVGRERSEQRAFVEGDKLEKA